MAWMAPAAAGASETDAAGTMTRYTHDDMGRVRTNSATHPRRWQYGG